MRTSQTAARLKQRPGTNRRWKFRFILLFNEFVLYFQHLIQLCGSCSWHSSFFMIVWGDKELRWTVWGRPTLNQGWDFRNKPHDSPSSEWDWGHQRTGIFQDNRLDDVLLSGLHCLGGFAVMNPSTSFFTADQSWETDLRGWGAWWPGSKGCQAIYHKAGGCSAAS